MTVPTQARPNPSRPANRPPSRPSGRLGRRYRAPAVPQRTGAADPLPSAAGWWGRAGWLVIAVYALVVIAWVVRRYG